MLATITVFTGCGGGDGAGENTVTGEHPGATPEPVPEIGELASGLQSVRPDYLFQEVFSVPGTDEPWLPKLLTVDLGASLSPLPIPGQSAVAMAETVASYHVESVELVDSGDGNCSQVAPLPQNDKAIHFSASHYGECRFTVTFNRDGNRNAEHLVVDYSSTPAIPPSYLTITLAPGSTETIDLASQPATQALITQGYALLMNSPQLFGNLMSASANGNILTVTASGMGGAGRVLFALEKTDDEGQVLDVKSAVLDVTITASDNAPQVAIADFTKTVSTALEVVPVDLIGEGIVTDANNPDELQIIHLNANRGGTVVLGDTAGEPTTEESYFHNHKFTFVSDRLGNYPVNYVVSDHEGGYASGTLVINVGKLTSPNSPLAATPGRMVEWVTVSDGHGQSLNINRPVLWAEVATTQPTLPDDDYAERDGERWAYTSRAVGEAFCAGFGLKLITATGFAALQAQYQHQTNGFMGVLGWQNGGATGALNYLIQQTDRPEAMDNTAVSATTGEFSDGQGLVLCVRSPEQLMTATPSGPIEWDPLNNSVKTVTLDNVGGSGVPVCTSSDTTVVTASCSPIENGQSTLTITGHQGGNATVTARTPNGENLVGNEPSLTLAITLDSNATSGPPILPTYKIMANLGTDGENWQMVTNHPARVNKRVRQQVRPETPLRVDHTYEDPDAWQQEDTTTVLWSGPGIEGMTAASVTPNDFGTVSVTLTPKNPYETGTPVSLSFAINNTPPEITNLSITSGDNLRNNTAFNEHTGIKAKFGYKDVNADKIESAFVWSQKRPWSNSWTVIPDATTDSLPVEITQQFFAAGGTYEGNDLRLTLTVTDSYGAESTPVSRQAIAISAVPTTTITLSPDEASPLLEIKWADNFVSGFLDKNVDRYDGMCQNILGSGLEAGQFARLLRRTTVDVLRAQQKTPAYWSEAFAERPVYPYVAGENTIALWNAATNTFPANPPLNEVPDNMSLVCEISRQQVITTVSISISAPENPRTMAGKNFLVTASAVMNDNSTVNATDTATWKSSDPEVATVSPGGVINANAAGTVAITATQDGVTSAPVHLTVVPAMATIDTCGALNSTENSNGVCLRYAGGSDQWFSSDPSLALVNALGLTKEYKGINQRVYTDSIEESGPLTSTYGTYVRFADMSADGGVNQRENWCQILREMNFAGRNNWRLPSVVEILLSGLDTNALKALRWPVLSYYASSTIAEGDSHNVDFISGISATEPLIEAKYVSCMSTPSGF